MATLQEMESKSRTGFDDVQWFYSETVTAGTSEPVRITASGKEPYVVVSPVSGSACVETTASSYEEIENDTATWMPWPLGDVTDKTDGQWAGAVTAMRLVVTGGSAKWEIVK